MNKEYAYTVAKKLQEQGWSQKEAAQAIGITQQRLISWRRFFEPPVQANLSTERLKEIEFLPELVAMEMHLVAQLRGLGYSFEQIADETNIPIVFITGEMKRVYPAYDELVRLMDLGAGRVQGVSENPSCVFEDCLAEGTYHPSAGDCFCPVHAAYALKILNNHQPLEAA